MSTSPTRPDGEPDLTPEDEQAVQDRMKTYEQDKENTVDAKDRIEQLIRERKHKRIPQPH
ncbi:MAG: hypothetical protein JOY62_09630 [Acidobacteriaceae bacterium]|nr:hypothetical protein [Acidobacteriaceae bacterium]MBV9780220.1 hypothetical protein [Acidobacteriaceae bacterium]